MFEFLKQKMKTSTPFSQSCFWFRKQTGNAIKQRIADLAGGTGKICALVLL